MGHYSDDDEGGGATTPPTNETGPCPGDPVKNPEIAPQKNSGIQGGMFGCGRNGLGCDTDATKKVHNGIDIKNADGAPVYAMYDGFNYNVERLPLKPLAAYMSQFQHSVNGRTIIVTYFHLEDATRVLGPVKAGDIIGYQSNSGNLKGAIADGLCESHVHVHVEVREHNGGAQYDYDNDFTEVDPRDYLSTSIDSQGNTTTSTNCN